MAVEEMVSLWADLSGCASGLTGLLTLAEPD
jgi:hypothetical protein